MPETTDPERMPTIEEPSLKLSLLDRFKLRLLLKHLRRHKDKLQKAAISEDEKIRRVTKEMIKQLLEHIDIHEDERLITIADVEEMSTEKMIELADEMTKELEKLV